MAPGVGARMRWRGSLRFVQLPIQRRPLSSSQTGNPVHLSTQFIPTCRRDEIAEDNLDSVKVLLQGGYIRQSSSGFFSFLPLGLRVLSKVQALVEEEMEQIGASKLEMPSMLSSALWHKTGRFEDMGSELYKVHDRRGSEYVLAPTFEEEITKLVGSTVHSHRSLPVKVFQTTRKYRDEPRPRHGLLRTKEFLMKDLYTFDADLELAKRSYTQVQGAYHNIMTKLFGDHGRGWRVAEADTGSIGGSVSHEYQVGDDVGEDVLFTCSKCSYAANSELANSSASAALPIDSDEVQVMLFGSQDEQAHGCTMIAVVMAKQRALNEVRLRQHLELAEGQRRLSRVAEWDWKERPEGPMIRFDRLKIVLDRECQHVDVGDISHAILRQVETFGSRSGQDIAESSSSSTAQAPNLHDYFQGGASEGITTTLADVHKAEEGDTCPSCRHGQLQVGNSIEVGHTFLLGARYTNILGYSLAAPEDASAKGEIQMGCYGIGITRIMGVLAQIALRTFHEGQVEKSSKGTGVGLAWNPLVAPFAALMLPTAMSDQKESAIRMISQALQRPSNVLSETPLLASDIAVDDRSVSFGKKLADADLVGYPLQIILGKTFDSTGQVEVRQRSQKGVETRQIDLTQFKH